ncbi:MAG: RnfABCDGE type electron transport complex subunit D [Acidobacteria bacterium]|nr:RnfABCDGE type electron transport complex subunit D [Acidobacteriota bacterium]
MAEVWFYWDLSSDNAGQLIGVAPVVAVALWVFSWYAALQIGICVISCIAFETLLLRMRGRASAVSDLSATVTGVILGLSLPWSAPWYVGVIASFFALGLGKVVFGGLGHNLFNPAMVGRAFVMIAFPAALGASAFVDPEAGLRFVTEATPLTLAKQAGESTPWWPLFLGTVNGSLGETSALACLLGGIYLCVRRSASWEIPAGMIGSVVALAGIGQMLAPDSPMTVLHHLLAGSLLFGAFFIATDPVSSPLTPRGKFIYGVGIGVLVYVLRVFSGYPEGVMFAVLLMNAASPLINRWTIPLPLGGPVPSKPAKK